MLTQVLHPRLSVVMPMRNCAHCVTAMLDSLPFREIPMQIVVVDDVSEDDSAELVTAWSRTTGQPVVLLRNRKRLYSYGSRLRGFAEACAPVVWSVDADDRIPPDADVAAALDIMEREQPDILHCRACGVAEESDLQKPLPWTEPVASTLHGDRIFSTFLAQDYPPAILWNKFFSAGLVKAVVANAPAVVVRYFDVKFLGLLFLLYAQKYRACNTPVYEYRMRFHRPASLYARQVDALLRLETALCCRVEERAPESVEAFLAYCRRRLVIQVGHLSLMTEAELTHHTDRHSLVSAWLAENIWTYISRDDLFRALFRSLQANAARLAGWRDALTSLCCPACSLQTRILAEPAQAALLAAAREVSGSSGTGAGLGSRIRLARCGFELGMSLAADKSHSIWTDTRTDETAAALLLADAQLARAITAIMAPGTDITRKAN